MDKSKCKSSKHQRYHDDDGICRRCVPKILNFGTCGRCGGISDLFEYHYFDDELDSLFVSEAICRDCQCFEFANSYS